MSKCKQDIEQKLQIHVCSELILHMLSHDLLCRCVHVARRNNVNIHHLVKNILHTKRMWLVSPNQPINTQQATRTALLLQKRAPSPQLESFYGALHASSICPVPALRSPSYRKQLATNIASKTLKNSTTFILSVELQRYKQADHFQATYNKAYTMLQKREEQWIENRIKWLAQVESWAGERAALLVYEKTLAPPKGTQTNDFGT
ncbi:MAG: hypothetical protein CL920_27595 [Deltaproteobacteria bacterium]|nr:hypothetical protein [Deltaproteobacteria bacterium]MBU52476.1 hypothetical protein [Deltaproteobacteria bacterium]